MPEDLVVVGEAFWSCQKSGEEMKERVMYLFR
jgi:hypothetical protein